jgi:divalent metal cation (Fe/Co/Zn/Cd) transporter
VTATRRDLLIRRALWLGWFTIIYNLGEGAVAVVGARIAGSDALLSFGLDSGIESISASVIVWRLYSERSNPERAERVEQRALTLIALAFFFFLAAWVAQDSIRSLINGDRPDPSIIGIAVTALSLLVMPILASKKRSVGIALGSRAVQSDSRQTTACVYLSAVVLGGLVLNALFGWWWADPAAALGVVGFLVREGVEALRAEHADDCC